MNLNQVTIPVKDVLKSIQFYETLGLKLIVHTHDKYARFECTPGGTTFSLQYVDSLTSGNKTTIYFEREDIDEYVKHLIAKGIEFLEMPTDQPWLWREALLLDPDGHPIKIYRAGINRLNPPWRLTSDE